MQYRAQNPRSEPCQTIPPPSRNTWSRTPTASVSCPASACRECYHLFKLRASLQAHESIRLPIIEAMRLAVDVHPELFRYLPLRDAPDWWPFPSS